MKTTATNRKLRQLLTASEMSLINQIAEASAGKLSSSGW